MVLGILKIVEDENVRSRAYFNISKLNQITQNRIKRIQTRFLLVLQMSARTERLFKLFIFLAYGVPIVLFVPVFLFCFYLFSNSGVLDSLYIWYIYKLSIKIASWRWLTNDYFWHFPEKSTWIIFWLDLDFSEFKSLMKFLQRSDFFQVFDTS